MILHKVFDCVTPPIFIISLIGTIAILIRKEKYKYLIISIFLFSITWRLLSNSNSSRYFLIFIIYAIIIFTIVFNRKNKPIKKSKVFFLELIIATYCLLICFSSFRNNYIFDLRDSISFLSKTDPNAVIDVFHKDRKRVINGGDYNVYNIRIHSLGDYENYTDLTNYYLCNSYAPNQLYSFIKFNSLNKEKEYLLSSSRILKVGRVYTSKNKSSFIDIINHPEFIPVPSIEINRLFPDSVFKAYIYEYDTFIYQFKDSFIWLIGKDINEDTEIVYHIYPINRLDLPKHRIQYGYDNQGFKLSKSDILNKKGKYLIITKVIPQNYHVESIICGFRDFDSNTIIWTTNLHVD